MTTPNRNRTKWHPHYNTCFSKSSNMDHLSELSNWSSTIAAPVQLTKRSTSLLSSSSTNSSHVFLVQYCPMGPFACPIGKLKLDAWFEKIQDKWHGVGVGVNNMEKKKKYKSTAFSLESCIKDIEVHIPMYLRTANDLFRSTQKKHRHRHRHRQMVRTLNLHPFKLRNEGKEKGIRRKLWLGMRRAMCCSRFSIGH